MSLDHRFRFVLPALLVGAAGWVSAAQDWYALELNPPALARLSAYQVKDRMPLECPPLEAVVSSDADKIFALCHMKLKRGGPGAERSQIVAIHLKSGKVVKRLAIPTKVGAFGHLGHSGHLFAFGRGEAPEAKRPTSDGAAVLIDTRTLDSRSFEINGAASAAVWKSGLSALFVLEDGQLENPMAFDSKVVRNAAIAVFEPSSEKSVRRIALPSAAYLMALSPDERWLYVVDRGYHDFMGLKYFGLNRVLTAGRHNRKKHRDGAVHVIDTLTYSIAVSHPLGTSPWQIYPDSKLGTVAVLAYAEDGVSGKLHEFSGKDLRRSVDLGECPQYLARIDGMNGRIAVSWSEVRFLADSGEGDSFAIPASAAKYSKALPASADLGGWLGEPLYLAGKNRLVFAVEGEGLFPPQLPGTFYTEPTRDFAFANLRDRRIDHVVKAGRSGVKYARTAGQFALAMGVGLGTAIGTSGFGERPGFAFVPGFGGGVPVTRTGRMAVSGDFLYALSTETKDVTVIRTENAEVVAKIAVGGGCYRIFASGNGRQVCAFTREDVTFIDTEKNQVSNQYHLPQGKFLGVAPVDGGTHVAAFGEQSLVFFDGATGMQKGVIAPAAYPIAVIPTEPLTRGERYVRVIESASAGDSHQAGKQTPAAREGAALVHFLRFQDDYSKQRPSIFFEGTEVAKIPRGRYFSAHLAPGTGRLSVGKATARPTMIDLKPGTEQYIEVKVKFTGTEFLPLPERLGTSGLTRLLPLERKWIIDTKQVVEANPGIGDQR